MRFAPLLALPTLLLLAALPASADYTYMGTCAGRCVELRLTSDGGASTLFSCTPYTGCRTDALPADVPVPHVQDGCRYWRWPGGSLFVCQG